MLFRPIPLKSLIATVAFALVGVLGQGGVVHAASGSSAKTSKSAKAPVKKASKPKLATRSVKKVNTAKRKQSVDSRKVKLVKAAPTTKPRAQRIKHTVRAVTPPVLSMGQSLGLHGIDDELDLNASVALVVDQRTNEVLFSKNDSAVLPIASLTKLMTGLVVVEAGQNMDETITITRDDIDTIKGSRSRLAVGTRLTRGEAMHLALMSSENRAANALGRHFPGGLDAFVKRMNDKAAELGMHDTRYVEPTGLSSQNRSSARDLAILVSAAYERPMLRDLSTSPGYEVDVGRRTLQYNNSNRLIKNPEWDIGLQKTGYISEAGRCLVMQASVAGRQLIMVFLDASGRMGRLQDAERVRRWVEHQGEMLASKVRPQG
ncbi:MULTISPECIES: serine hydrolase [Hydrogenophaga]|jgi:D-alanyl-D-alanine endopeptidase (penicillin-binding protein 7)|uniref:Putative d-alanyl-D-alanine endopeptidase-like protein n=1 Tax=Hydrogenophaga intermedia TaxID=65786 RepID=A0A1L1PS07_HYDIT|nr:MULTISPECIES: serine hydrolase [Hydrogenophaga]AOS79786.1 D-alanyl-D-alanine carboxypeptidase [Hydrogenophaga sp. PBC]TMU77324.1 D-alanyl-D-alanine carboxypeptidase [Hydrogenophaga intermedia]CDN87391.1 Putative d-alanyl-D-alanine endopeptidase-like protein [Hydrogenophaga intermedia]